MTKHEFQFEEEVLEDMADALEQVIGTQQHPIFNIIGNQNQGDSNLLRSIGEVANKHDVSPDDRVDLACEGFRWYWMRVIDDHVADFRKNLEDMEAMFR